MRTNSSTRCGLWAVFCALAALAAHGQQLPRTRYTISLAQAQAHLAHVSIELKAGAAVRRMQLPVWNALYQVRDFSQYINWVKASTPDGKPLPVVAIDKSIWQISGASAGAKIEYEIFSDVSGPYGAQLDAHHAFFNMADSFAASAE